MPQVSSRMNAFGIREFKQVMHGKSLGRILMNNFSATQTVTGKVLDLGSKTDGASYHRYLKTVEPCYITHTDLEDAGGKVLALDVEKTFPVGDAEYNTVLCFNLLEHVYDAKNVLKESQRVLKTGGTMIGTVPFFVRYHPDPSDFFRYTSESLKRLAMESGFSEVQITPLGLGPFTAGASLVCVYMPAFLRLFMLIPAGILDRLFFKHKPILEPLGFGFKCLKN